MLDQSRVRQALERNQFWGKKKAGNHRWSFPVLPSSGQNFERARIPRTWGSVLSTGLQFMDNLQVES